jgi:hypothetical protein
MVVPLDDAFVELGELVVAVEVEVVTAEDDGGPPCASVQDVALLTYHCVPFKAHTTPACTTNLEANPPAN